jgi:hypothetical protein
LRIHMAQPPHECADYSRSGLADRPGVCVYLQTAALSCRCRVCWPWADSQVNAEYTSVRSSRRIG